MTVFIKATCHPELVSGSLLKNMLKQVQHDMILHYAVLLLVFMPLLSIAQDDFEFHHPELKWETIETEHFLVHYHQGTVRTANKVAEIAEEVYPHVTGLYQYEPHDKTEIIIKDTDDYSNGAAYFYDNKVEIWAENLDYILRGTHNWLRDVVTHEYIHIISLEKSLKFSRTVPAGWFQVFGYEEERRPDVVRGFPDILVSYPISGITVPVWFAEGVSQFQTPSKRFDYRDSHREMILRDRVMTGKLLDYDAMSVFGKNSIGNESAYNQGFAFVNYLAENYGDSIVSVMAGRANSPLNLNFKSVIKRSTGKSANEIFLQWHNYLKENYTERLSTISAHIVEGQPFLTEGIGNLHPTVSPNGNKVAYLKTGRSDYLSRNQLEVQDLKSGGKTIVTGPVSSSITWSPDSRYLAYAKKTDIQPNGSLYDDIYIYDLKAEKEYKITNNMRARNPDWSHQGNKLAFVITADGVNSLMVLELNDLRKIENKKFNHTAFYSFDRFSIVEQPPESDKKDWQLRYRKVEYSGRSLKQLTYFTNGRQIYHPRWAPDDSYIVFDTSIKFGRDIAKISPDGGQMTYLLNNRCDERYPVFHPATGELYFSCDETGIFNIYSLNLTTGEKHAHTNIIGGAFMPSLTRDGDMFYSQYKNQGYKLYRIDHVNAVDDSYLTYIDSYPERIPDLNVDDKVDNPLPAKPYKRSFPGVGIMPRVLLDYGTVKPGFYLTSNETLNKLLFLGGADINADKEYDLFALFEFKLLQPTFFVSVFNQTAKVEDDFEDPFYVSDDKIKVDFNLLEADFGLRAKRGIGLLKGLEVELAYIFSLYRARIGTFTYTELATNQTFVSPPIRYSYLRAHSIKLLLRHRNIKRDLDRDINPRGGRYITFRVQQEWNRFLDDFATDRAINIEVYKKYYFRRYELNWEEYFTVPFTRRHSLSLRFQGGLIDEPVDDFFHFFAGGLIGLKGYPFYSIQGSRMAIGSATYRLPLLRNINKQILNVYFDKVYVGGFYQFGNAWTGEPDLDNFVSDVGFQIRMDTFSWYLFPTRIFFEAAYPLKEHFNEISQINYEKDWKFYVGVLFDFDLRLEKRGMSKF
jgi:Tol biopolymer transport system component